MTPDKPETFDQLLDRLNQEEMDLHAEMDRRRDETS